MNEKLCAANGCSVSLAGRRPQTVYCSHNCSQNASMARLRARADGDTTWQSRGSGDGRGVASVQVLGILRAALLQQSYLLTPDHDEREDVQRAKMFKKLLRSPGEMSQDEVKEIFLEFSHVIELLVVETTSRARLINGRLDRGVPTQPN